MSVQSQLSHRLGCQQQSQSRPLAHQWPLLPVDLHPSLEVMVSRNFHQRNLAASAESLFNSTLRKQPPKVLRVRAQKAILRDKRQSSLQHRLASCLSVTLRRKFLRLPLPKETSPRQQRQQARLRQVRQSTVQEHHLQGRTEFPFRIRHILQHHR